MDRIYGHAIFGPEELSFSTFVCATTYSVGSLAPHLVCRVQLDQTGFMRSSGNVIQIPSLYMYKIREVGLST